jgi:hypothetical protein
VINFELAGGMGELRMRWTGTVAGKGTERNEYGVLVGKPEGKRPLVRPRCGWGDIIKIGVTKNGMGGHRQDMSASV